MDPERRQSAAEASKVLASLAHPTRLLIICLLLERERFVQELLAQLGSTKGNISQHLRVLEHEGHVTSRKEGNRVFYRIAEPRLKRLVKALQDLYCPGLASH